MNFSVKVPWQLIIHMDQNKFRILNSHHAILDIFKANYEIYNIATYEEKRLDYSSEIFCQWLFLFFCRRGGADSEKDNTRRTLPGSLTGHLQEGGRHFS